MLRTALILSTACLSMPALAADVVRVKDNGNFDLHLSQSNYNRVLIKGDKVLDFAYPEGALAIKRDAADGSVYLLPAGRGTFTLFMSTEAGRHYSATVNAEEGLGKIIELQPDAPLPKIVPKAAEPKPSTPEANPYINMLQDMEQHKKVEGVTVSHVYGKAERLAQGLTILPREVWEGKAVKGEVFEIYNASDKPLELSKEWFIAQNTEALKLSAPALAPKQHAFLYRIESKIHA